MKKLILMTSTILASSLLAFSFPSVTTDTDSNNAEVEASVSTPVESVQIQHRFRHRYGFNYDTSNVCGIEHTNCFNAFNHQMGMDFRIQTRVAGKGFQLRLRHRNGCGWGWHHHISVALIDNLTGELITTPQDIDSDAPEELNVSFKVKNAYRNVSVKFFHMNERNCDFHHGFRWMHRFGHTVGLDQSHTRINDLLNKSFVAPGKLECHKVTFTPLPKDEVIECPTDLNEITKVATEKLSYNEQMQYGMSFIYAIPKNDKCYQIDNPCDSTNPSISQSSDSFAIRPDHFEVTLPSHIKANTPTKIEVSVKDAEGDTITNYNNSSSNLKVTFKDASGNNVDAQYAFEIRNGQGSGTVIFSKPVNGITVNIADEHFADIDKADTPDSDRITSIIPGSSSTSTVSGGGSKYWAGAGTNEIENNPRKNTLDADIKQNTKKDLHYQKMNW